MQAIEIREPGGPEVLVPVERPLPEPGPGQVRVRVRAAGVNRPDCLQRLGLYPPPPGASDIPGLEVSGVIDAVGPGVFEWREGDAVMALVAGGGYAEACVAPSGQCIAVPGSLSWEDAAAVPETFFTVWANVFEAGGLNQGTLLVHGGSSGIGSVAIQLAKFRGSRVIATCGSDDKCAFAESLGADRVINHRSSDFVEEIANDPRFEGGVDVVLDMVGGDYVDRNLKVLRPQGRHVSIAFLRGASATIDIKTVMRKQLWLTGSTLRGRPEDEKLRIRDVLAREVVPYLGSANLRPAISHRVALADASEAHRIMEAGEHRGKIVLRTDIQG